MALQQKYDELIRTARSSGVSDLQVREQDNVLYIDGSAPSEAVKKQIWDVYNRIDPNYRSSDVVMNLKVSDDGSMQEYEVVKGDSLSRIGQRFGVNWRDIFEANKNIIKDPDLIQPGWRLKIPRKK